MKVGLQLYTLRDDLARDFEGTLEQVAEMGYEGVQFAGYQGRGPSAVRDLLGRLNLRAAGAHVSFERLEANFAEEAAVAREVGFDVIAVPWWNATDEDGWRAFSGRLGRVVEQAAEHGVTLCYHNHAHELTQSVAGEPVLDFLFSQHEALATELDVAWLHAGGKVPHEYLRRYAGRAPLVHLKDYRPGPVTVPLGDGVVDLAACVEAARSAGTSWLLVEQDNSEGRPLDDVRRSLAWLRGTLNG